MSPSHIFRIGTSLTFSTRFNNIFTKIVDYENYIYNEKVDKEVFFSVFCL